MEELWRLRHRLLTKKRRYPVGPSEISPTSSPGRFSLASLEVGRLTSNKAREKRPGDEVEPSYLLQAFIWQKKNGGLFARANSTWAHALIVSSWIDNPAGWAKALIWRKVGPARTRRWPTASKKGSPTRRVTFLTEPSKKVWPGSR